MLALGRWLWLWLWLCAPNALAQAPQPDLLNRLEGQGHFTRFLLFLERTGQEAVLRGPGPLTVLAPVDEAFIDMEDGGELTILLNQADLLHQIVAYHLVAQRLERDAIRDGEAITTLHGKDIILLRGQDGAAPEINGLRLTGREITATNGIIQPIEGLLLPPGL